MEVQETLVTELFADDGDDLNIIAIIQVRIWTEDGSIFAEPIFYDVYDTADVEPELLYRGQRTPFHGIDPFWRVIERTVKNSDRYHPDKLIERLTTTEEFAPAQTKILAEQEGNVYHLRRSVL